MRKHKAFTLIELLVVISIIALLIGILLPALSNARKSARQIKSNVNLRSIHTALVVHAQENDQRYAGVQKNSLVGADAFIAGGEVPTLAGNNTLAGSWVQSRFLVLLGGNFIDAESIVSPAETAGFDTWDPSGTYDGTSRFHSYSLPQLINGVDVATHRFYGWSANMSTQATIASDRLEAGDVINTELQTSLWTTPDEGGWSGGVSFNDNSTVFLSKSEVDTAYAGWSTKDDYLFVGSEDVAANKVVGPIVPERIDANAKQVYMRGGQPSPI